MHGEVWPETYSPARYCAGQDCLRRWSPASYEGHHGVHLVRTGAYQILFSGAEIDFEALYVWHLQSKRNYQRYLLPHLQAGYLEHGACPIEDDTTTHGRTPISQMLEIFVFIDRIFQKLHSSECFIGNYKVITQGL